MRVDLRIPCGVVLAVLTLAGSSVRAQTGPELMLKPFPKELGVDLTADAWINNTGHSKQTDGSLKVGVAETEGRFRLNPGDIASPRFGFGFKYMDIDSDVPQLPKRLFDQSVGFAMPLAKWDDWVLAASVGLGYAGEAPFGDGNGWYGRADVLLVKDLGEGSALTFGIDYDGNRTFKPDVPLPGFAYVKRIREDLLLTVGLPVTRIEWQPAKHFRLELEYLLVDNFEAKAGYNVGGGFEVFGSIGQRTDAFFLNNQRYGDDRLIFQQRRAEVGVTYRTRDAGVGDKDAEITLAVGYAFNGEFSVGFDSNDSRLISDVSDEPYVRLGLQLRF